MITFNRFAAILSLLALTATTYIFSQIQDTSMASIFKMDIELLMNTKVSIATKSDVPISESPAVVSVITSQDIKNMGARELEDVLQTVPGFELTKRITGEYGLGVRGLKDSRTTSKLLIMIDGNPYNQIFYGNSFGMGYDINIDVIKKIEIIRGPGSALYGRNAFSGVINIITKKANMNEKSYIKTSIGNRNEKSISGTYNLFQNKFKASINARKLYNGITDSKAYNEYGELKDWNLSANNTTISANFDYGNISFSGMYFDLKDGGFLSQTYLFNQKGYYSVAYNAELLPNLTLNASAFGHNSFYTEDIEQLRPGFDTAYKMGIYYRPELEEFLYGIETSIKYRISLKNELLLGIQSDYHGIKNANLYSNVNLIDGSAIGEIGRTNAILYQPGWFVNNGKNYKNLAFYIQNIWHPLSSIGITLGGRYDFDSQIGGQFNPRLGLVFEPFTKMNIKLLYGRAYRAPSPNEQYQTVGYIFGNQDLKPEVINTFEIAINYRNEKISNSLSFFRNEVTDIIYALANNTVDPSNKTNNIGKNTSQGIEYECKTVLLDKIYAFLNYSFTISENSNSLNGIDTSYKHSDVAPHKFNFGINYSFNKHINLNINAFYRSKMNKYLTKDPSNANPSIVKLIEVGDNIGNYFVLNSALRIEDLIKNLTINCSLHNILDTKYYAQDNDHYHQPAQPGRQFIISAVYSF